MRATYAGTPNLLQLPLCVYTPPAAAAPLPSHMQVHPTCCCPSPLTYAGTSHLLLPLSPHICRYTPPAAAPLPSHMRATYAGTPHLLRLSLCEYTPLCRCTCYCCPPPLTYAVTPHLLLLPLSPHIRGYTPPASPAPPPHIRGYTLLLMPPPTLIHPVC